MLFPPDTIHSFQKAREGGGQARERMPVPGAYHRVEAHPPSGVLGRGIPGRRALVSSSLSGTDPRTSKSIKGECPPTLLSWPSCFSLQQSQAPGQAPETLTSRNSSLAPEGVQDSKITVTSISPTPPQTHPQPPLSARVLSPHVPAAHRASPAQVPLSPWLPMQPPHPEGPEPLSDTPYF